MTADEVRALPVCVDVPTAGRPFGIGRDGAYDLARSGRFPVPVLRLGRRLVVTRASLLTALGLTDADQPVAFTQSKSPVSHASLQATSRGDGG